VNHRNLNYTIYYCTARVNNYSVISKPHKASNRLQIANLRKENLNCFQTNKNIIYNLILYVEVHDNQSLLKCRILVEYSEYYTFLLRLGNFKQHTHSCSNNTSMDIYKPLRELSKDTVSKRTELKDGYITSKI
jgi:hypothetical protein